MLFRDMVTKNWWQKAQVRTYDEALAFFKTAKNPSKGKPFRSWGRLFMKGENIHVHVGDTHGLDIGHFSPDNKFTFTVSPHDVRSICAQTMASSLYRGVPFMWQRVGVARYRVDHVCAIPTTTCVDGNLERVYMEWSYMRTHAAEYFAGIQFDLNTGKCLNRKPDLATTANAKERKVWLSSLRKFKYGIKARCRVGVFEPIAKELGKDHAKQIPDWSHSTWQDLLYTSIKQTEFPIELIRGITAHAIHNRSWYKRNDPFANEDIIEAVNDICTTYSIDLRKRFGVFDEVSQVQKDNEVSRHEVEG
jgi:hypothetical protein